MLKKWDEIPDFMKCEEVKFYYDILLKKKLSIKVKRIFDIALASFMLIILAVPMIIIMNYVFIMKCGYIAAGYTTLASNLILTALHYINSRKIEKEKVYDFKFCLLSVLVVTISCLLCNLIYKFTWVRYGVILIIILIVFKFRNKLINSITAMKV